jgi:hypothetical protein
VTAPGRPDRDPDVSVVVTGHGEGPLAAATFGALLRAVDEALAHDLLVEVVGVLDRADAPTRDVFTTWLGADGPIGRSVPTLLVETDLGDPGAARNAGVRTSRAPWVCVLDADNLPTRSWLAAAHARATGHGAPCVVHPEHQVVFGERWQAWPQLPSDHPGFRVQNLYDRTYWDTFCLAAREVFEEVPYAATSAASGLGPEDWHWGMETVHAGFAHLVATRTALLYRVKTSASIQEGHEEARSLLPPTRLLVDLALATYDAGPEPDGPRVLDPLQEAVLRPRPTSTAQAGGRWWPRTKNRGEDEELEVSHYRALHADVLGLDDEAAARHYREVGRPEGRRGLLTDDELRDLARLDLDDYRELHPDLRALAPADLVHHYLAHGRTEGRAPAMTPEQRDARRPVVLSDAVVAELQALHEIEADVPLPSDEALAALRHVGPPSDGSVTSGSRAWWDLLRRIGTDRPDAIVFSGEAASGAPTPPHGPVLVVHAGGAQASGDGEARSVRLEDLAHWERLSAAERRRLMATLVVQLGPSVVRHDGSAEFAEAAAEYATALASVTHVVDTTVSG